jgi:hypothetical protein
MKHAARATELWHELRKFMMSSDYCVPLLEGVLSEADKLKKSAKKKQERITLLERAAKERDEKIRILEDQKSSLEGRLKRLTKAKITRNSGYRLARSKP